MSIIVCDVSDDELHRACIIEAAAYAYSDLTPLLFPGPPPPDSQRKRVDQLVQMRKDDPTVIYMQAIDKASGRMIASSKWHVYNTPEAINMPSKKMEFGPGTNPEACMAFFGGMKERKKELMGSRPHLCTSCYEMDTNASLTRARPSYATHRPSFSRTWSRQCAD